MKFIKMLKPFGYYNGALPEEHGGLGLGPKTMGLLSEELFRVWASLAVTMFIAGVGPGDVDVMEVHDATAFGEIAAMEGLGFCPKGEGGVMAERGDTALDGKIPVNPSGGLISRGHPVGASGLAQIYEVVTQLRGEAGERQVKKHRIAMTENGGGTVGMEEAALTIHMLEKV